MVCRNGKAHVSPCKIKITKKTQRKIHILIFKLREN